MAAEPAGDEAPASLRFEFQKRLGQGGSGVVYEALDRQSGQRVAVKAIAAGSPAAARLQREVEARSRVTHPNLVELRELIHEGSWCFLVMELVEGQPFVAFTRRSEPAPAPRPALLSGPISASGSTTEPLDARSLPPCPADSDRTRAALRQLAEGLEALHQAGVVHRDIKDANVLVRHDGQLRILDFGLAVALSAPPHTLDDPAAGTPAYLSPEQASGQPPSAASDWYSVGVLLYEALTGRLPFVGDPVALLMAKRAAPPPPPGAIVADPPDDLQQLCLRLLARDPAQRPSGPQVLACCAEAGPHPPAPSPASWRGGENREKSGDFSDSLPPLSTKLERGPGGEAGADNRPQPTPQAEEIAARIASQRQPPPQPAEARPAAADSRPGRRWLAVGLLVLLCGAALGLRAALSSTANPAPSAPGAASAVPPGGTR